jgi:hypothetical protein
MMISNALSDIAMPSNHPNPMGAITWIQLHTWTEPTTTTIMPMRAMTFRWNESHQSDDFKRFIIRYITIEHEHMRVTILTIPEKMSEAAINQLHLFRGWGPVITTRSVFTQTTNGR